MPLETFGEEKVYNLERIGSFGRFYTGHSFPIEYVMTIFSTAELSELTLARDIRPEKIDFELLMQRDIDEERVRLEMEPYLNPQQLTPAEMRSKVVFFPPLLAAIVPTKGKTMEAYYSDEQGDIELKTQREHIIREWPGLFKLTYFSSHSPNAYRLQIYKGTDEDTIEVGVQREPVQLEIRLARGNQYGARLIIIDGQHRLFTLKKIYEKQPELLENLGVPVCILFAPHSTAQKNKEYASFMKVPTVPEVFRHLFVDVNTTAKQVSGHFSILLSDNTIANLTCRKFCDEILNQKGPEGLAVIEWNTKTKKHSTIINRAYSLTSIGIIDKALTESLSNRKALFKYVLNLEEVKSRLYPHHEEEPDYPVVQWDKFSLGQKSVLEEQIKKYLVPCLELIFFNTQEFLKAFDIFNNELNRLKELAHSEQQDALEARQTLSQILDYIPIGEGKSFESVRLIHKNFESKVRKEKNAQVSPIIQYALFQRAIIEAWAQLLEVTKHFSLDPRKVTQGFVKLLDLALQKQEEFWVFENPYMQHTVFSGTQIIGREETKRLLSILLLAHLGNRHYTEQLCRAMGINKKGWGESVDRLHEKGQQMLLEFMSSYSNARKKTFRTTYRVDLSIQANERKKLIEAEEEQLQHLREVKEKRRSKNNVSKRFDTLVEKYVKQDIAMAMYTLKKNLGLAEETLDIEEMPSSYYVM